MNVLVVSDSHGSVTYLRHIIEKETDCEIVFFLGDGESDIKKCIEDFPEKKFVCVCGNCDSEHYFPDEAYKYIEGNTVAAVHGHRQQVKLTLSSLLEKTSSVLGNVAFYGHTHRADTYFDGRILAVNPGAVCEGSYAVVSLTNKGPEVFFKSVFEKGEA